MGTLSEEQEMIRSSVREFAEGELAPTAERLDAEGRFPEETLPKLAQLNLLGLTVAAEHGGAGVDAVTYAVALEEVARVCGSTALVLLAHNSLAAGALAAWGTPAQKRRWLGPLAAGEMLGAFALAEPAAGSDAAALVTTAVRRGDGWELSGRKAAVANAARADLFVVVARSDPGSQGAHGTTAFVVERGTPGLAPGAAEDRLGFRAAGIASLGLVDVAVDADALLGREGEALAACGPLLDRARIGLGAIAVGLAQGAFERALRYARERPQFGKPIAEHQSIQERLADMAVEIHAARLLVHDAARAQDAGGDLAKLAAMAKLFASEVACRAGDHAIQVHGGYGYIAEYHVERAYRDAKLTEIAYGTSEMLRLGIARALLGEADAGLELLQ